MKFAYKFSNLLGTVYRKGSLVFSPDGNSIYSPVGNRITVYDLKNNQTQTLGFTSRYNYESFDISPNGLFLACVNERGEAHIISLVSKTIIYKYRFKRNVPSIKFSPDGKYLAVLKENSVFVFKVPGTFVGEFKGFEMIRVFQHAQGNTTCMDWSSDSKVLAVGSQDMTVRLYTIDNVPYFKAYSLASHKDTIINCFFEKDSLDVSSISCDGTICIWECNIDLEDLEQESSPPKQCKPVNDENSDKEDDVDIKNKSENEDEDENSKYNVDHEEESRDGKKIFYKRVSRQNICSQLRKADPKVKLCCAAYHKNTHVLVTGYSTGAFFLHEIPSLTMIHSLSICDHEITAVTLNNSGDWIALASSTLGHLLVWEWQSETYIMKQQGHLNNMTCLSYSSDGMYIATGGCDGKVKLWNTSSGFCFVTFNEHSSNVTAVQFSQNRNFVASASLDGTVRAFDLIRYRNFKTFTSPTPVQFSCLAIDSNGDFIAAGGQDKFEIYLWSFKIGRLCEILTGHEGPVVGLAFNPILGNTALASVSWDKTLRLWNAVDKNNENEVFLLGSDGLTVAFRPDGKEVAVTCLDGQITFFDVKNRTQSNFIEGRNDLGSGVSETDVVSSKKNLSAKAFMALCYTADGSCVLAGGQSKNVCIYNVEEAILLKKFELTENRSLDNVNEVINRRKITDFGNIGLIEKRERGDVKIRLPGVRQGDMATRGFKPEIRVFSLEFSPTGQAWAAATTEGLLIYSLNMSMVFDPLELNVKITPEAVRETLQHENHSKALMMAIKLGERSLVQFVIERVPHSDIELCVTTMSHVYIIRCLKFISSFLENSRHLEFYLSWIRQILTIHGSVLKGSNFLPILLGLQKSLTNYFDAVGKICEYNKYTTKFLLSVGRLKNQEKMEVYHTLEEEEMLMEE
ncbi:hypothetical protein RUM43_006673 [Polyplax serrata]|uniref:Small-subunit processome Utp12 domain-containing protein n=1 Tax=Polyplax serrata TaxID=468196 RepID=A0AAN8NY35_POLSC